MYRLLVFKPYIPMNESKNKLKYVLFGYFYPFVFFLLIYIKDVFENCNQNNLLKINENKLLFEFFILFLSFEGIIVKQNNNSYFNI